MLYNQIREYPIEHWSYSSLTSYLSDRYSFKKKYILKIYDDTTNPSALVGTACHKVLESFFKGVPREKAILEGQRHIDTFSDQLIKYGKTGSREKINKDFSQAINFYFAEQPKIKEVLGVEETIVTFIHHNDVQLALPIKAKLDLITRDEQGRIVMRDHKFVSAYSDSKVDDGERVLQAMFYYYAVKEKYGEIPYSISFDELKITNNSNGDPQLKPYIIIYEEHPNYHEVFISLYNDCTEEISTETCKFLPNVRDMFSGQDSFEGYRMEVTGIDSDKLVVQHRTKAVPFTEKQFVPSYTDQVENMFLSEEEKIRVKLQEFGIAVDMQETYHGPAITKFTFKPTRGVKMSKIEQHAKDLAIALKSATIRVEAPIMGTDLVGVEIPALERKIMPWTKDLIIQNTLSLPIGVDVFGATIRKDLKDMPHLLIAGSTGSGKSVIMNVIIRTLLEQNTSEKLKMVLIDPKRVELAEYNMIPHLLSPVIYDTEKAARALLWLVNEMEERYKQLESLRYKNIDEYNDKNNPMHKIIVVIDEMADLMLTDEGKGIETSIVRLAQKARAVGIHLIVGTQRPSVDVITGLIKANLPTRICFMTASSVDSRVVLDQSGAEELTGKGDMLFLDPHNKGLKRLQGFYL